MADVVDDDTCAAVIAAWKADPVLPGLFAEPPQTGRLKSPRPALYTALECKLDSRQMATTAPKVTYIDKRKVTLTAFGQRADVVKAMAAIRDAFGIKTKLAFPSGSRFLLWEPIGDTHLEEDKDTKAGKDVWKGKLEAVIWSVRNG